MKTTRNLKYSLLLLTAVIAMTLTGCTRNNGDIGDWFGAWRVETITVDGEPAPNYGPPYMIWKFQSSIVQIQYPNDVTHECPTSTGVWHQEGDKLYLDMESGGLGFNVPEVNNLPLKAVLDIKKLSRHTIELQYISNENITYFYTLKKWG